MNGVAALLAQIKEENVAGLVDQGKAEDEAGALTEDDSKFTLAEETRREMRREEKKKRKGEEFKNAVANCEPNFVKPVLHSFSLTCSSALRQTHRKF
jgi:U1 small nuclear ribonucleoprotein